MHLDDSESWNIGKNIDLFSVTLHELGHALGLGHSDNPNDVMYPYYKMNTGLQAGDIAGAARCLSRARVLDGVGDAAGRTAGIAGRATTRGAPFSCVSPDAATRTC